MIPGLREKNTEALSISFRDSFISFYYHKYTHPQTLEKQLPHIYHSFPIESSGVIHKSNEKKGIYNKYVVPGNKVR